MRNAAAEEAPLYDTELSMGWVDPRVGLGWVGSKFFSFLWVGLGHRLEIISKNSKTW